MTTAFNDPAQGVEGGASPHWANPHEVEFEVHRRLQQHPHITVHSLVVRRLPAGVCLEGRIEVGQAGLNLRELLRDIPGLVECVDHLVVSQSG